MASIYRDGQRVKVLLESGEVAEGVTLIRCGMREQGDWFVTLDDGRKVLVFHSQMEALPG